MYLLFTNLLIPVCGYIFLGFCNNSKLSNLAFKFLPILLLMNLLGLNSSFSQKIDVDLFKIFSNLTFGFTLDGYTLTLLFLLGFIWTIFVFYLSQISNLNKREVNDNLKLKITAIFALLNFTILANNIVTTLFFYNFLLLLNHFFAKDFLYNDNSKLSLTLKLTFHLQSFLMLIAIVLNDKITGNLGFSLNLNSSNFKLFLLFFFAFFLVFLIPHLFYNSIKNSDIFSFYFSFFILGFGGLIIFSKIVKTIFLTDFLIKLFSFSAFQYFEILIFISSFASLCAVIFSKTLKSSFFYLLSEQCLIASFSIILFGAFEVNKIHLPLFSSALQITLMFLIFSNFVFYSEKAKTDKIKGLFYDFRINSVLLIWSLLILAATFPAITFYEKFFIAKIIFQKELWLSMAIFILNFVGVFIFGCKLSYLLLSKVEKEDKKEKLSPKLQDEDLVDYDFNLALTPLLALIAITVLPIFLQFKIGIFNL